MPSLSSKPKVQLPVNTPPVKLMGAYYGNPIKPVDEAETKVDIAPPLQKGSLELTAKEKKWLEDLQAQKALEKDLSLLDGDDEDGDEDDLEEDDE